MRLAEEVCVVVRLRAPVGGCPPYRRIVLAGPGVDRGEQLCGLLGNRSDRLVRAHRAASVRTVSGTTTAGSPGSNVTTSAPSCRRAAVILAFCNATGRASSRRW